jgi:hypothetical protein
MSIMTNQLSTKQRIKQRIKMRPWINLPKTTQKTRVSPMSYQSRIMILRCKKEPMRWTAKSKTYLMGTKWRS